MNDETAEQATRDRIAINVDAVVVGGGPAGLSAAESLAARSVRTMLLEQHAEIGSPTRTTGGSFIAELRALGIAEELYHPVSRGRFISPHNSAEFIYDSPAICVLDVRGLFQFLAAKAAEAGAILKVGTTFTDVLHEDGSVVGVTAKDLRGSELVIRSKVVIDATGYRSLASKRAGMNTGFARFGVGAEYDLYAPRYDQREAVLIVGSQIAPAGYAWAFPWGKQRVRVGVGIIHADSSANPHDYLEKLLDKASTFGLQLEGAQPLEYHYGLIPSEGLSQTYVGDGIVAVGDSAGQAPVLVGEGIRWAIMGGQMIGEVLAETIKAGDCSRRALRAYQKRWQERHGRNLRIAHEINKRIAKWPDEKWDEGVELLKLLSPEQFAEALGANFLARWLFQAFATNPRLMKRGAAVAAESIIASVVPGRSSQPPDGRRRST
jgi:digeranylgeranylglycerophospholipid reductase